MMRERGFTLVSLMVGLFVSMLVLLAVYGSGAFFETNRRQMISGNAAFENAMATLLAMQRSTKQAGMAISLDGRLSCRSLNIFRSGVTRANSAAAAPVLIGDGGADSDTLTVTFADSLQAAMPAQSIRPMDADDTSILVPNEIGFQVNDLILVGTPGANTPCTLMQISSTAASVSPAGSHLLHEGPNDWNPADRTTTFTTMPSYPTGSLVQRVGNWNWLTYRVTDGRLEEVDNLTGAVDVIAEDIVYMKAAYGTTDGVGRTIEQWVPPVDPWDDPSLAQLNAIRAVLIAVVARNPQRVKPSVAGGGCDATSSISLDLWAGGTVVDLSRVGADWNCFTYRTLRLAVPLRNVIFGS